MVIENHKLTAVLIGIHLVALPLYAHIPVYILLLISLFTLWTLLIVADRVSKPKKITRIILVGVVVLALMVSYGRVLGQGCPSRRLAVPRVPETRAAALRALAPGSARPVWLRLRPSPSQRSPRRGASPK